MPVDHSTAINDDTAEFDEIEPSADRNDQGARGPERDHSGAATDDAPSDAGGENDDPGGADQFGSDPQELQGDDPASGGS